MHKIFRVITITALACASWFMPGAAAHTVLVPTTVADSTSVAFGTWLGHIISQNAAELNQRLSQPLNMDMAMNALEAVLHGEPTTFTAAEASQYMDRQLRLSETAMADPAAEAKFIQAAAVTDGYITTPSGLVFGVVLEGEGAMPTIDSRVKAHYQGRLSDGTVFDDTTESGQPVELTVGHLVPGMAEALQMMKPGGVYRVVIPADLGYGSEGIPGVIPGNAALDFTVTLIEIINQ